MASLPPDIASYMTSGVAHQVAACSASGRPVLCRALAAQLEPDGRVLVVLSRLSAFEVLAALAENPRVALNLTAPCDYQSVLLKGDDATIVPDVRHLRPMVTARHLAFRAQLDPYGYPHAFTESWYDIPDDELIGITFTPTGAWNQTPGPGAGRAIAGGR